MNEHNAEPAWREHPTALYVWWLVDKTGALIAEVGSVNVGGGGAWYAVVGKDRLPLKYASKEAAQRAAETALAAPVKPEAVPTLTDDRIEVVLGATYRRLVADGYSGGMGSETWDKAAARAIEAEVRGSTQEVELRTQVRQADERGDEAMRRARAAEALLAETLVPGAYGARSTLASRIEAFLSTKEAAPALHTQAQPLTLTDIRLAVYRGRDKWGAAIGGDEWDYIADEVFALLAQPASSAPVELTDEIVDAALSRDRS